MRQKRILVIDDEAPLVEAICDYLSVAGYLCASASGAAEAIALLDREPFDVVLTDISLSGQGDSAGLDIVSHIREARLPSHVLIMTAHDTEYHVREGARLAARVLRKPIALSQLAREIDATGATTS